MANTTHDEDELKKQLAQPADYYDGNECKAGDDEDYDNEQEEDTNDETADEDYEVEEENEVDVDDNGEEDNTAETYTSSRDRDVADAQKAIRALRNLTADEDDEDMPHNGRMKLSAILGGDMLGGKWFRKQFWFIVMLTGMLIIYISNRYYCQQEMLETKALNDTLLDRRYKALTRSSQLKEKTRRSYIEETLVDTTLQTANTPSFNLKIE